MRKSIVLSGKRDPDLVALYQKVGSAKFSRIMRDSLRMITREGFVSKEKLPSDFTLTALENSETVKVDLCITSEKDQDIEELLSHVRKGELGYFVKHSIRIFVGTAVVLQAFLDSEYTAAIASNPVPVQVFSIGGSASARKEKTRKPRQKTKVVYVTEKQSQPQQSQEKDAPEPQKTQSQSTAFPTFPTFGNSVVNQSKPVAFEENMLINSTETNQTDSALSEEDEMLAMLEGLLG